MEFARAMMPEGESFSLSGLQGNAVTQQKKIAILSHAHYNPEAELQNCLHWSAGWMKSWVDGGDEVVERLHASLVAQCNARKELFTGRLERTVEECTMDFKMNPECGDVMLRSAEQELGSVRHEYASLLQMHQDLFNEKGMLIGGSIPDGNCGPETLFRFGMNWNQLMMGIPDSELEQSLLRVRFDLKQMWQKVAFSSDWQLVWFHFLKGHVDVQLRRNQSDMLISTPNRKKKAPGPDIPDMPQKTDEQKSPSQKDLQQIATPVKNMKRPIDCPFTSDNPEKRGKLLASAADTPRQCVLVDPENNGPDSKPKKRSGRPKPAEEVLTFESYFQRFCSEIGMTYRNWVKFHRNRSTACLSVGWYLATAVCEVFDVFFASESEGCQCWLSN